MSTIAATWAAALTLTLSSASAPATDDALDMSEALCFANAADPTKVISAADAAGWGNETSFDRPGRPGSDPVDVSSVVSDTADGRWRTLRTQRGFMVLKVDENFRSTPQVRFRSRTCTISRVGVGEGHVEERLRARMGRDPNVAGEGFGMWSYDDLGGPPVFVTVDEPGAALAMWLGALKLVGAKSTSFGDHASADVVIYSELSLAPKP